jgi:hypothetical protein
MTAMEQRMLVGGSWTPDETPDGTPECLSGTGPGLPLQMHAFVPGGLHDHPPSTSSVMVVMQSLGVAEHQQGQPGARSSGLWERGRVFDGGGGGIEAGSAVYSDAGATADQRAVEPGGWRGQRKVAGATIAVAWRREP